MNMPFLVAFIISFLSLTIGNAEKFYKEYMIQIKREWLDSVKEESETFGLKYKGKIVSNIHLFEKENVPYKAYRSMEQFIQTFSEKILAVEPREYSKISFSSDCCVPSIKQQWEWILARRAEIETRKCWPYYGMGIQEVWSMGYTGKGVNVAVVDNGVEFSHTDLQKNVKKTLSRSFVKGDDGNGNSGYLHSYQELDADASHGTLVAGLVAAEYGNGVCSSGVAFNASIISLKVFKLLEEHAHSIDILFPEDHISQALEHNRTVIDIYVCSFNLDNKFSSSTNHIRTVLRQGVIYGRNGKGNIFVFSAGNSRRTVHDCNTTPYANSIYTVTIASVGLGGTRPDYSVPCTCTLASTYGEYTTYNGNQKLESTMIKNQCENFSGTSASAALASGVIALVLQANSKLTWRDVQYIIVISSSLDEVKENNDMTITNGYGLKYNPYFGFGVMNATAAVLHALKWKTVPGQINFTISEFYSLHPPSRVDLFATLMSFPSCKLESNCLRYIEQVRVNIDYQTSLHVEDQLEIILLSPSNTSSVLLHKNPNTQVKDTKDISRNWNFTSVQFWGENPQGKWILIFISKGYQEFKVHFFLRFVTITFFGTATNPYPDEFIVHGKTADVETETHEQDIEAIISNALYSVVKRSGKGKKGVTYQRNQSDDTELCSFLIVLAEMVFISLIYIALSLYSLLRRTELD